MDQTYTVNVYNPATRKYETVSVTKEVYDVYRRTAWNIKDNDERYYAHEIQFSALIGGDDGAYENFHEFIDREHTPENAALFNEKKQLAYAALGTLTDTMRRRYIMRYESGLTVKEIAHREGVSVDTIKESLGKAQDRLQKFLRKFQKETL